MTALLEPRAKGLAGGSPVAPVEHPDPCPAGLFAPVLRELRPLVDALRAPGSPTELLARALSFARAIGLAPVRLELRGRVPALEQAARDLGLRVTRTEDDLQPGGLWLWCEDALGRVHPLAWLLESGLETIDLDSLVELLREHTGGAWPLWLAPEQVRVLPAREGDLQAASAVARTLRLEGLRVGPLDVDGPPCDLAPALTRGRPCDLAPALTRGRPCDLAPALTRGRPCDLAPALTRGRLIGRVAAATAARVNYLIVVGATEAARGEVSVRIRGSNAVLPMPLAELLTRLHAERNTHPGAGARARDGSATKVAAPSPLPNVNKE